MTPEFPYVQLPGAFRGFFRKASLWEGIDHILVVNGTRFSEEYRRFYFRDIQAFIVEKRSRGGSIGWWAILLIILVFAIIAAANNDPPYSWVGLIAILVILGVRCYITFGQSCRCSVQTAVSREQVPSVMRRKDAEAVLARLQNRINAEQGFLPAEIPMLQEEIVAAVLPADPATTPTQAAMLEDAGRRETRQLAERSVNWAVIALFILLLNSVFTFFVSSGNRQISQVTAVWVGYGLIALGIFPIFLALQHAGRLRALKGLRVFLIAMLGLAFVRSVLSWTWPLIMASLIRTQSGASPVLFQRYYANTNGALQLTVATVGMILIFAKWETYRRGEPSSN